LDHADHVNLLKPAKITPGGLWADLGSGTGAFTLALAELLGPKGIIYSVDQDKPALEAQRQAMNARFPSTTVYYRQADFTREVDLPPLDGIVMANSLHFHRDKDAIVQRIRRHLKAGSQLLLVEYNTDRGNSWVPFPLSYGVWATVADRNGFTETRLLARRPSRFMGEIYSAQSTIGNR